MIAMGSILSTECWRVIGHLCVFAALLLGCINTYHLNIEKEWSGELQSMVDHDMMLVSRQNKLINDLFAYCYKLQDQVLDLTPTTEVD